MRIRRMRSSRRKLPLPVSGKPIASRSHPATPISSVRRNCSTSSRRDSPELEATRPAEFAQLRDVAQKAFIRAKEKKDAGDIQTARDELSRAAAIDPTLDGIRELQRELRIGYPILYVGVRQFPANLSPSTARLDSEKQAVELIFEGLLEEVPEESGAVRYRPGAALAMPSAVPGGREFGLRMIDRDAAGRGFDSHDVAGTVKLLRRRSETWQRIRWHGSLTNRPPPKTRGQSACCSASAILTRAGPDIQASPDSMDER